MVLLVFIAIFIWLNLILLIIIFNLKELKFHNNLRIHNNPNSSQNPRGTHLTIETDRMQGPIPHTPGNVVDIQS